MTAGTQRVDGTRQWLRGIEVFAGPLPDFDPEAAPADPVRLFLSWLLEAVADGVRDPHAMTLSTVDPAGDPDARVLLLKGLDASGWQFAGHGSIPKGGRLACHPRAALTFYWAEHGRQVRIRGAVTPGSAEDNAADFLARNPGARTESLLARQSQYLTDCTTQSRSIPRRRTRPPARRSPPWRPGGTGCWRGSPPSSPPAPNAPPPAPSSPGAPMPGRTGSRGPRGCSST